MTQQFNSNTRSQQHAQAQAPAQPAHQPAGNGGQAATFTEAPASLTLKITYRGYNDVLFTLRSNSGVDLLGKLDAVLNRLEQMGAEPAPARGSGGSAHVNGGQAAAGGQEETPVCPYHGPMARSKKFNGWFCKAKMGDGSYCREQVKG